MLKISVIVPIYQVEKYLKRCVDSIINQTYKNLEIILVDDGSPDNCGKICDAYAEKDARIKVIHKENGGLSDARNAGLDKACGDYIAFVDSDDYISEDMFECLYDRIMKEKSDMSVCDFIYVDEAGNMLDLKRPINNYGDKVYTPEQFITDLGYCVTAWNKLYKRELWENIRFPFGKIHEDEFVFHRIVEKCKTISYVNKKMYYYVQRNGSIMNKNLDKRVLDISEAYTDRINCLLANGWKKSAATTIMNYMMLFFTASSELDLKENENKDKIIKIKKSINKVYFKIINYPINKKIKFHLGFFVICPKLYKFSLDSWCEIKKKLTQS